MKRIFCALLCIFIVSSLNANNGNSKNRIPHLQKTWHFKNEQEKKKALRQINPIHVYLQLKNTLQKIYKGNIKVKRKNKKNIEKNRAVYFTNKIVHLVPIQEIAEILITKKDPSEIKNHFNTYFSHKHKKPEDFAGSFLNFFFSYQG